MLTPLRKLFDLLDARERRRFWLIAGLVLVMGFANMVGIAALAPFLAVLADPETIRTNDWLAAVYDGLGFTDRQDFLVALGAGAVIVFLMSVAIRAGTVYALFRFGAMRVYTLSARLLAAYLRQPYAWFLSRNSTDLAKTVLSEVGQTVNGVAMPLLNLFANLAVAFWLVALLVAVDPRAALAMMVVLGGGYGLVFALVRRRLRRIGRHRWSANSQRFRIAKEALSGIKEVKVLGLEDSVMRRFHAPARRFAEAVAADRVLGELPRHLLEGIAFGGLIVVLLVLLLTAEGDLAAVVPVAGVYVVAGARLAPALQVIYRGFGQLRFNMPALEALHDDFRAVGGQPVPVSAGAPPRLVRGLALRGVRFTYPGSDRPALDGVDLEIRANTTVGIVGGTGAGKTSAMDVVLGLLEPQEGRLEVDGRAIEDAPARRAWRRTVGYVPQEIFLADDSVAANIAFGQPAEKIDMAAVERAARQAQLHDFVTGELAEGYATAVGERGVRLSGGQRQRIGIARALYHDPDLLVFDEATSALDTLTERAVMEAVAALGGAKTVIMVAHRLSTVRGCDEIFLLERGCVLARGSYDALVEQSATFREMARSAG